MGRIGVLLITACGTSAATAPTSPAPLVLASPSIAVEPRSLALSNHGCTVTDGRVACWGYGFYRQLGVIARDRCNTLGCETRACWVDDVHDAAAVAVGENTSCAIDREGRVACWGNASTGVTGASPPTYCTTPGNAWRCDEHPKRIVGLPPARRVVASYHACAIVVGGDVWCWGSNTAGQLGATTTETCEGNKMTPADHIGGMPMPPAPPPPPLACSTTPIQVPKLHDVIALAAGGAHTCAVTGDGSVTCWGDNAMGQLGGEPDADGRSHVAGLDHVVGISAAMHTTCAWQRDGRAACWGNNNEGQLGYESSERCKGIACSHSARTTLDDVAEIGVGFTHACARRTDGHVDCWGLDATSQLGSSGHDICGIGKQACAKTPLRVAGITAATALAVGFTGACVVDGGRLRCWGGNSLGSVGDGTTTDRATPVSVLSPQICAP
jgi:alpha-tubulin suppressor-like RCC1 family protein